MGLVLFEVAVMKFGCYLLGSTGEASIFDFVAYSGYKFFGSVTLLYDNDINSIIYRIIVCLLLKLLMKDTSWSVVFYGFLSYICLAIGFFMV